MIRHAFNMIEVALAMAVVTLGVVGVLALLPPALDSSRDARYDAIANEAAANIFEFAKILAKNSRISKDPSKFTAYIATGTRSDIESTTPSSDVGTQWMTNGPDLYYQSGKTSPADNEPLIYTIIENGVSTPVLHARMYAQNVIPTNSDVASAADSNVKRVFLEITWPITAVYKNRQKRLFVMDFFLQ